MGEEKIESWEEMLDKVEYIEIIKNGLYSNGREKIKKIVERAKEQEREKWIKGFTYFAWWKDGVQYVGERGTTLKQAIKMVDNNIMKIL